MNRDHTNIDQFEDLVIHPYLEPPFLQLRRLCTSSKGMIFQTNDMTFFCDVCYHFFVLRSQQIVSSRIPMSSGQCLLYPWASLPPQCLSHTLGLLLQKAKCAPHGVSSLPATFALVCFKSAQMAHLLTRFF